MMQVVFLDSDSDVPATCPRQNGEQSALIGRQGVVQGEGGAGCGAGQVQSEFGTGRVKECGAGVWFADVMQGNCGAYECGAVWCREKVVHTSVVQCGAGQKWCIQVWCSVVQAGCGAGANSCWDFTDEPVNCDHKAPDVPPLMLSCACTTCSLSITTLQLSPATCPPHDDATAN